MPVDIYNKNFQNWLKGVFGLNITRSVLCQYITDTRDEDLKDIPALDLKQFFTCLCSNNIFQLKTPRKGPRNWECKHEKCKLLMDRFVHNHTERGILKFEWRQSSCESIDNLDLENKDIDSKWKVVKLYMHVEKEEAVVNYNSIECLDISHAIKVIRNCKVFFPDGSAEPCEKVLNLRNKLMHSPDNLMDEKETEEFFKWTRKLLDCLDIAEKTYYKAAIEELQTLAEKDFVMKYQSEENKKNMEKISKAKIVADELHNSLKDGNQLQKCKCLLDILQNISGSGLKESKVLEMEPAEYKTFVKDSLQVKSKTITHDIAECDENSDEIKELENLKQHTEKVIEEVEEVIQTKESEEMIDLINSLYKELEDKKAEEIRLTKISDESAVELEKLSYRLESLEQEKQVMANEVEEYKKRNRILKEKTSSLNEEKCNEHQQQELIPSWLGHSFSYDEELQCDEKTDDPDFTVADKTLNENPSNPNGNEPQLQELNLTWPGHSFSYDEELQFKEKSDDPYFILTDETLNENPLNPNGLTLHPRHCHLIKWPNFQLYGFILHKEKEEGTCYISEIDENSPAENGGLRKHDRIIEVDNENIENETFQQVCARIRAGVDEIKLLVVDQKADAYYKSRGITITSQMPGVEFLQTGRRSNARTKETNVDGAPVSVQAPQQTRSEPTVQKSEPAQANNEDFTQKLSAKKMRELLAQRKKNDPKQKSNMDFRSKKEIFEKM